MLELDRIDAFYGSGQVLWDVSLSVPQGSVVVMLGRNGMGKTTIIRSVMGLTRPSSGQVRFKNEVISGLEPHQIARKGVGLVPQGRRIFPSLSVRENLLIGARGAEGSDSWDLERVYALFPILRERQGAYASLLSGGEQQMLAVARALMMNPALLLMDEPSEGLAPMVIEQIADVICRLKGKLTVFLAEQNFNMGLSVADYIYIISKGSVVYGSTPQDLRDNEEAKQKWLGVQSGMGA